MTTPLRTLTPYAATLIAIVLCLSSCGFLSPPTSPPDRTLSLPVAPYSELIVIADPDSPTAMDQTAALIAATARTGENAVIIDDHTGMTLAASPAMAPPTVRVPAPPAPPTQPTSFQRDRYLTALRQYKLALGKAEARLGELQRAELTRWATRTVASAQIRLTTRSDRGLDIAASLGTASADLSSLRQIGTGDATRAVVVIVGVDQAAAQSALIPPAGLQNSTIVVADFAGESAAEAAWQASLLEAGARRAVLLTPATDDQLTAVVRQALDGAIVDSLTNVLFGLGQYRLSPAALPQLRLVLRLLTVRYSNAEATIVGYTDDLPTPGGNQRLSDLRAQAVANWLIAGGVARDRLQVYGDGDTDPIAPNTQNGQPLDRRVDVIIDPAVS